MPPISTPASVLISLINFGLTLVSTKMAFTPNFWIDSTAALRRPYVMPPPISWPVDHPVGAAERNPYC